MLLVSLQIHRPGMLQLTGIFGAVLLFLVVWLRRFRIVVANGKLTYYSLFGKQSVALDEVRSARTEVELGSRPPLRIVLEVAQEQREPVVINMKPFRKEDLRTLFRILGPKMAQPPRLSIFGKD
ncbi:MAG TPA: hypothetical protein VH250_02185 [Granulicella sp.]|nr:hypothetical protein [Granulicella sp.]